MPRKKSNAPLTEDELALQGITYHRNKAAIKALETENKKLRTPLEDAVMGSAGKETTNGSRVLVIPHADKEVVLKETLRCSKVLLPEAIEELEKAGLEVCIEEIKVVREDVLEALYEKGKVSDELLQKIYQEKSSYAFSVDVKDRMPDEI